MTKHTGNSQTSDSQRTKITGLKIFSWNSIHPWIEKEHVQGHENVKSWEGVHAAMSFSDFQRLKVLRLCIKCVTLNVFCFCWKKKPGLLQTLKLSIGVNESVNDYLSILDVPFNWLGDRPKVYPASRPKDSRIGVSSPTRRSAIENGWMGNTAICIQHLASSQANMPSDWLNCHSCFLSSLSRVRLDPHSSHPAVCRAYHLQNAAVNKGCAESLRKRPSGGDVPTRAYALHQQLSCSTLWTRPVELEHMGRCMSL